MKKLYISTLAATLLLAVSCKTDFENSTEDVVVTSGDANFSKYVALGNSLTSGYRDGTLYIDGQNESYPSMLAKQMMLAGGGEFKQPMMPNNTGGFSNLLSASGAVLYPGKLMLKVVNGALSPQYSAPAATLDNITSGGPYQNMGVPGAKSFHLLAPGYGNPAGVSLGLANPYFARFASSASASVLGDAVAQKPTFFSLWIGANDVLSYASSGGMGVDQKGNTNPATYGSNDISDPNVVAGSIKNILDGLKAAGTTKGVISNIPYVSSVPYFTTVPYNPLTPAALGANLATLNTSLYGPLKQALTAFGAGTRINLLSSTSANPVLIKDTSLANLSAQLTAALTPSLGLATATAFGQIYGQARQATAEDYVLLTASSVIASVNPNAPAAINVNGVSFPLDNQYVLTKTEAALVTAATDAYNTAITGLASQYGLALVDSKAKMIELNSMSGIQWDGVKYNAKFVTGGAFSLDGVHPTGRGYAIIANEFLKAINMKYKSNLPMISPNSYTGVTFP
jgi:hypothetical protein